jgi:hypothetical protein
LNHTGGSFRIGAHQPNLRHTTLHEMDITLQKLAKKKTKGKWRDKRRWLRYQGPQCSKSNDSNYDYTQPKPFDHSGHPLLLLLGEFKGLSCSVSRTIGCQDTCRDETLRAQSQVLCPLPILTIFLATQSPAVAQHRARESGRGSNGVGC